MNPFEKAPSSKKLMTFLGICAAMVVALFQSSGLSTVLPAAVADVGGQELYPLASTLGGAITVLTMPLFGWLGARYPAGKRTLLTASLVVGALVCFARALAPNMPVIIVTSLFWAFTSAGVYVISYTMIRDMYPPERAGVLLGTVATMSAVGTLAGPVVTGLLIDNFGWRMACHALWPPMMIAAAMVFFGVKVSAADAAPMARDTGKFDFLGCLAFVLFLGSIILVLSMGASASGSAFLPFGQIGSNLLIAASVVGLVVFVMVLKKKGDKAIVPIGALKNRNVAVLTGCNITLMASAMALYFFVPSYVLLVMKGTATQAALTIAATSLVGLVLGPIFGKWIGKTGSARGVLLLGTLVRLAVTVAFLLLLKPTASIWLVYVLMFLVGIYNIQATTMNSAAPQIQVPAEIRVQGNSVIQLGMTIGSSIGMAVYTLLIAMYGLEQGLTVSLIVALVLAVIGLFLGLLLRPLPKEGATPEKEPAKAE
ncbi:MAG: MFS transporter [Bifidobacteriaceae bacterium]|jgi:MFS family permease|nr:MFS transporter [Bifidobacteriaceae bacterium]